jgi:hypothetical protein
VTPSHTNTFAMALQRKDLALPPLPLYKEGHTDADMAEDLGGYLHLLLENPEVVQSQQFLSFLHDSDGGTATEVAGSMVPVRADDNNG